MTPKALREQRATLAAEIQRLDAADLAVDASGNFTEAWVKVNNDYNAMTRRIEVSEMSARIATEQVQSVSNLVGREDYSPRQTEARSNDRIRTLAIKAWFSEKQGFDLDADSLEACHALRFNPRAKNLTMPIYSTRDYRDAQSKMRAGHHTTAKERLRGFRGEQFQDFSASLSIGSGPKGGYLVPPEDLIRELEVNMLWYGGMRQVAETIRTSSGERMSWPTADDTGNAGIQIGEASAAMPSDGGTGLGTDPNFAKVYWDAYKFSSQAVLVPYELLQDSAFSLAMILGEMFGIRLGRIHNTKFTLGTGAATPMGLVSKLVSLGQDTLSYPSGYAKGYIKTATAAKMVYDDFVTLEHSVDPAYRKNGTYMMHDQVILALRQLKDGIGRPLWQSNVREGIPDTFNGHPLQINQDMDAAITTGKNIASYGDHSFYKIRDVGEVRIYHLEERYRDTDQDGFIALSRNDGNLLIAGNAPVKLMQVT